MRRIGQIVCTLWQAKYNEPESRILLNAPENSALDGSSLILNIEHKGETMNNDTKPVYIVTGAAGFLGNNVVRTLQGKGEIRALVLPTDEKIALDGLDCTVVAGSILVPSTLEPLFEKTEGRSVYVIHCAGEVDIASDYNISVYAVNVTGTRNVCLACLDHGARLVYISSVHAMPPRESQDDIEPAKSFDPDSVAGLYAKVKAEASKVVLDFVEKGLKATLIQPSGLIGPYDYSNSNLSQFISEAASGKLPACVSEGYSFVDVRDAAKAIVSACENGKNRTSYILAGPTVSMMKLARLAAEDNGTKPVLLSIPIPVISLITPITSAYYRLSRRKPLFTQFALETLESPSNFNTEISREDLGFTARPIEETIKDTVDFLRSIFRIDADSIIKNSIY